MWAIPRRASCDVRAVANDSHDRIMTGLRVLFTEGRSKTTGNGSTLTKPWKVTCYQLMVKHKFQEKKIIADVWVCKSTVAKCLTLFKPTVKG